MEVITPVSQVRCLGHMCWWGTRCLAQDWHLVNSTDLLYTYLSTISISMFHTSKRLFFLPTSKTKTHFSPLGAILSPLRMRALKLLLFCVFVFLPWGKGNVFLIYSFLHPQQITRSLAHRSPFIARWMREQTVCLQVRRRGLRYKWFPWVTKLSTHSHQYFNWCVDSVSFYLFTKSQVFSAFLTGACCDSQVKNVWNTLYTIHGGWFNHES